MITLFQKPPKRPPVPIQFGKYYPDWEFIRKHGERNCDGMVWKRSRFDPVNGAWVMCTRKAKYTERQTGLQLCAGHMKRRPSLTCTHALSLEILDERALVREQTQELLQAGQERPFSNFLEKHQRLVDKGIAKEWGEALRLLSLVAATSLECWNTTLPLYSRDASTLSETLHMIHGQAGTLARAIVNHCRKGEIQSAMILWRSLFELEVNMSYISKDTTLVPSRAERYQDWSMANYFRVNNLLSHDLMVALQRKYNGWYLKNHDGWTATPDNPRAISTLQERALQVGYGERGTNNTGYPPLHIYNLCHSYVHNNMFGMLNDPLTARTSFQIVPSAIGLDTPICLTALSLKNTVHLLLDNQPHDPDKEYGMPDFGRLVDLQVHQVLLEVAMVPEELCSPLGGIDVTFVGTSDEGTEYVGRPKRRGTTYAPRPQRPKQ